MKRLLLGLMLIGCGPTDAVKAERWPTYELLNGAKDHEGYGGFPPGLFVTFAGDPLPFRGADYETPAARATADGWSVMPAFAQGQPAAYVVTEMWQNHPDPWMQPVYVLVTEFEPMTRQEVGGIRVPTVFGVGDHSTFYSPFWQAVLVKTTTPAPLEGLPDTRSVLEAASESLVAARPLCPMAPDGFTIAAQGPTPSRPFTGAGIKQISTFPVRVDGARAAYADFGPDRYTATASGLVRPSRIFFFTRNVVGERTLLELPAVLAANAVRNGYVRRTDVVLETEVVFVPAGKVWDAVREKLGAPTVDPAIPAEVAAAYALRVARNATCFDKAATFPAGCDWLDSEAAIDRLEARRVVRTEVTMTAVPVLFPGAGL